MIPCMRLLGAYCGRHLLMTQFWVFTVNKPVLRFSDAIHSFNSRTDPIPLPVFTRALRQDPHNAKGRFRIRVVQSCARSSASLSILSSLSIRTIRCSVVSVSWLVIEVRKQAAVAAGVTVIGLVVVVRKRTGRTNIHIFESIYLGAGRHLYSEVYSTGCESPTSCRPNTVGLPIAVGK